MRTVLLAASLGAGVLASAAIATGLPLRGIPTVAAPARTVDYTVRSGSMEPTLLCSTPGHFTGCTAVVPDRVAVREPPGHIVRGDIVLFGSTPAVVKACGAPGLHFDRVIGLPGDRWAEHNGTVLIDGKPLTERYVSAADRDDFSYARRAVPAGDYFVEGDNRAGSCDSRAFGPVPAADILGKVVRVIRSGPFSH